MKSIALKQWEAAAYAAGRLTQLRRVVKSEPAFSFRYMVASPYGAPGDRLALWEGARMPLSAVRWHPVITAVRLERVQEMSEADAQACGFDGNCPVGYIPAYQKSPCVYHYASQFDSNNPRTPWESNPWVWVIDVEGVKG